MKHSYLVGIDEVGRGPLAGPVTLAALILAKNFRLPRFAFPIKDSKKLAEKRRNEVYAKLKELRKDGKLNFSVSHVNHFLIDRDGLTKCVRKGIAKCLDKLEIRPGEVKVLLDGSLRAGREFKNQQTIIKGDEKIKVIALASIVAKVSRDRVMCRLARQYPEYDFHVHKGYGTKAHYKALKKHGPCPIHRRSFLS